MRVALTPLHVRWSFAIDPAVTSYPRGSHTLLLWWFGGTLRFLLLFLLAPLLHPPLLVLVVGLHFPSARRSKQASPVRESVLGRMVGVFLLFSPAELDTFGGPGDLWH